MSQEIDDLGRYILPASSRAAMITVARGLLSLREAYGFTNKIGFFIVLVLVSICDRFSSPASDYDVDCQELQSIIVEKTAR